MAEEIKKAEELEKAEDVAPQDAQKLSDDALDAVAGGLGRSNPEYANGCTRWPK